MCPGGVGYEGDGVLLGGRRVSCSYAVFNGFAALSGVMPRRMLAGFRVTAEFGFTDSGPSVLFPVWLRGQSGAVLTALGY